MFANQLGTLTDHELETLCTPMDECLTVTVGPVDTSILAELETRQYDQAPVYSTNRCLLGLVDTQRLRTLHEKSSPLLADDPAVCDQDHQFHIGPFVTVSRIFETLSDRHSVLVFRGSSATEYGYVEWHYGLLTISDLNRQPLRAALYSVLAELESGMANLVDKHFQDPWVWVKTLAEENQVRLLGYWELTRRLGIDVGPIAATTLAQLFQVVAKNKELLSSLGYDSRNAFESQTGTIAHLRNSVMHPVRPLVLDQDEVAKVLATLQSATDLFTRVEKCTRRGPYGNGRNVVD